MVLLQIHLKKFLLENPEFRNWTDIYKTENILSQGKPLHPISLKEGELVSGKIAAIKGSFIIIDTEEELVSLNLKSLSGRECDLSSKSNGLQLNTALQNSLF